MTVVPLVGLFSLCDEDRDGFVSRDEMIAVTEVLYRHLVGL